jgi:hypothetical protein
VLICVGSAFDRFLKGVKLPPFAVDIFFILGVPLPPLFPLGVKAGLGLLSLLLVKLKKAYLPGL